MTRNDRSSTILASSGPQLPAELENAIGRLVRESLQHQLGLPAASMASRTPTASPRPTEDTGYRIVDSVVSLGVLERLPEGTSRVSIGPRAVVTPAAAELLRHRGVRVVRIDHAAGQGEVGGQAVSGGRPGPAGESAGALSWWIADGDHPERTAGYVRQLAGRGISAASAELPLDGTGDFAGTVGVVVAELPAIHVDRLARQLSIPAAAVGSLSEVARIASAMSPSVWVLDAERLSFSGRVAVAAECFRQSSAHASPTDATSRFPRRPR